MATGALPLTRELTPNPLRTFLPVIVGSVTAVTLPLTIYLFLAEPPYYRPSSTFLFEYTAALLIAVFAATLLLSKLAVPRSILLSLTSMKLGLWGHVEECSLDAASVSRSYGRAGAVLSVTKPRTGVYFIDSATADILRLAVAQQKAQRRP